MGLIDADALEKDGWRMNRNVQINKQTMEYQTRKPTDFPTIEPQPEQRWIPCSERLPKKTGYYICTCHDGACYRTSTLKWSTGWILTGARSYWKVMAWMPLPEPYGGGRSEDWR